MTETTVTIAPKTGHALLLKREQRLRVIDLEGGQVADLVAYAADDHAEHLSQGFTRVNNDKATLAVGDRLYSNVDRPMLRLVSDSVGVHDLLFPPCNAFMYRHVFGIEGKTGCREHLAAALEPFGIAWAAVTDPFNVFMHTAIGDRGEMLILPPTSRAGDHVELEAEMDLVVAVSACAADVTACNGGRCTSIGLEVR